MDQPTKSQRLDPVYTGWRGSSSVGQLPEVEVCSAKKLTKTKNAGTAKKRLRNMTVFRGLASSVVNLKQTENVESGITLLSRVDLNPQGKKQIAHFLPAMPVKLKSRKESIKLGSGREIQELRPQ